MELYSDIIELPEYEYKYGMKNLTDMIFDLSFEVLRALEQQHSEEVKTVILVLNKGYSALNHTKRCQ